MNIYQNGNYETSDGYEITIIDLWYGANPRVDFEVRGKKHTRTREQFEDAIRDKKIVKVPY